MHTAKDHTLYRELNQLLYSFCKITTQTERMPVSRVFLRLLYCKSRETARETKKWALDRLRALF